MCGVFGVVSTVGRVPFISVRTAIRLRDMLTHRGPDDAGLWARDNAILTHRRLAVIDPSPAGRQPFTADIDNIGKTTVGPAGDQDAGERFVLVYNGELYNDAEIRRDLEARGERFTTTCDTETVMRALVRLGSAAIPRFRGMFALAFWDRVENTLLLARDPLGVKPMYYHLGAHEITFASEPPPILACPNVQERPDPLMATAYLTTIRTVIGERTMFDGVRALPPGHTATIDVSGTSPNASIETFWRSTPHPDPSTAFDEDETAEDVRRTLDASTRAHLRSDVPTCALLSGGLDSTVIALTARQELAELRTYAAGARSGHNADEIDDLTAALEVARELRTDHAEAIVDEALFTERWPEMVALTGVPMSTPNEVAINTVARRLRADGCVVTLSGEGADELFGGYAVPLTMAHAFFASTDDPRSAGRFQLDSCAWVPVPQKSALLRSGALGGVSSDAALVALYEAEFVRAAEESGTDGLAAHLRFQRRVNLTGLLQRLDTATMLASVEGRTPFADARVAEVAEGLPMSLRFRVSDDPARAPATKIVLRAAYEKRAPGVALRRRKASFPLPFERWLRPAVASLRTNAAARELFSEAALGVVGSDPERAALFAWPMVNLAMWFEQRWGGEAGTVAASLRMNAAPPKHLAAHAGSS